jgi:hypothetical protein
VALTALLAPPPSARKAERLPPDRNEGNSNARNVSPLWSGGDISLGTMHNSMDCFGSVNRDSPTDVLFHK